MSERELTPIEHKAAEEMASAIEDMLNRPQGATKRAYDAMKKWRAARAALQEETE